MFHKFRSYESITYVDKIVKIFILPCAYRTYVCNVETQMWLI